MRRPALLAIVLAAACGTSDPVYLDPTPRAIEVDPDNDVESATASVVLPVRLEDESEAIERQRLAMSLGLDPAQVPQARRDDYEVALEWTLKNLTGEDGTAFVHVVGASEFFAYDPGVFQLDERDPPPPPLLGGIPVLVPANGTVSGVFREDQLAEAAQDWDAISRGGVILQQALLVQWPDRDVEGGTGGELAAIPSAAVAALVRLDVTLAADRHMVLEAVLRVRDHGDRLAPFGDPGALVAPSTAVFTPPPPAMP